MIRVSVKWCPHCGELECVRSVVSKDGAETVEVYCRCGVDAPRVTKVTAGESYMLDVDVKKEAGGDDDPDPGDV